MRSENTEKANWYFKTVNSLKCHVKDLQKEVEELQEKILRMEDAKVELLKENQALRQRLDRAKEENEELKSIIERAEDIETNREDFYPAIQEATHYNWLDDKFSECLEYCEKYIDQMWAANVVGILLGCEFREAKQRLKELEEEKK